MEVHLSGPFIVNFIHMAVMKREMCTLKKNVLTCVSKTKAVLQRTGLITPVYFAIFISWIAVVVTTVDRIAELLDLNSTGGVSNTVQSVL